LLSTEPRRVAEAGLATTARTRAEEQRTVS
jgi:hypothetical protein